LPPSILLGTGGPSLHLVLDPGTLASSPYVFAIACAIPPVQKTEGHGGVHSGRRHPQDVQACGGSVVVGHGRWPKKLKTKQQFTRSSRRRRRSRKSYVFFQSTVVYLGPEVTLEGLGRRVAFRVVGHVASCNVIVRSSNFGVSSWWSTLTEPQGSRHLSCDDCFFPLHRKLPCQQFASWIFYGSRLKSSCACKYCTAGTNGNTCSTPLVE